LESNAGFSGSGAQLHDPVLLADGRDRRVSVPRRDGLFDLSDPSVECASYRSRTPTTSLAGFLGEGAAEGAFALDRRLALLAGAKCEGARKTEVRGRESDGQRTR
jgi:hypothetical protein